MLNKEDLKFIKMVLADLPGNDKRKTEVLARVQTEIDREWRFYAFEYKVTYDRDGIGFELIE